MHSAKLHTVSCLPDCSFHLTVIQLVIVQLSKEWKQHLYATDGVDGTVDGVSHRGFHIL